MNGESDELLIEAATESLQVIVALFPLLEVSERADDLSLRLATRTQVLRFEFQLKLGLLRRLEEIGRADGIPAFDLWFEPLNISAEVPSFTSESKMPDPDKCCEALSAASGRLSACLLLVLSGVCLKSGSAPIRVPSSVRALKCLIKARQTLATFRLNLIEDWKGGRGNFALYEEHIWKFAEKTLKDLESRRE